MAKEFILVPLETFNVNSTTDYNEINLKKEMLNVRKKIQDDDDDDGNVTPPKKIKYTEKNEKNENKSNFDVLTPEVEPPKNFKQMFIDDINRLSKKPKDKQKMVKLFKELVRIKPDLFSSEGLVNIKNVGNKIVDSEDMLEVIIYTVASTKTSKKPVLWNYFLPLLKKVPFFSKLAAEHLKEKFIWDGIGKVRPEEAIIVQLDYN